jgi:RNA polymerase sigma-70 factor (sigma-E family)
VDKAAENEFRAFVAVRGAELMRRAFVLVGGDHDAAKDLVQEALIKAAARWSHIDEPMAFLRTVMYRQQISWWRRGRSRFETTSATVADRAGVDSTHITDVKLAVRAAMSRLTAKQRAVLFLRYFEDLPEADVASVLGCSVGTVRSTNHRALERLRAVSPELADVYGSGRALIMQARPAEEVLQ